MTPSLSPSALVEEFEGEFVIHLPDAAKTYLADPIMVLLLSHCDGKNDIARITNILVEMYPERSQQVSEDVPQIIKEMLAAGVLKV